MSYIPKSQIAVKVADPGKFQYESSGEPYTGFYIETSKGIRYAGASNMNLGPTIIPVETPSNKEHGSSRGIKKFDIIKPSIKKFLSNTQSIPSMKKYPSEDDYTKGFFKRYFSRRINSAGYQEIDEDVYNSIQSKEKKYDHNLNEIGSIRWNLKGNVFKDNALALERKERKFKGISYLFPIFDEFAREPMQNQENLHTEGGELYYGDGTEYIGDYHVHTTMGPMVGSYHTENEHLKLYYTSELPAPPNMSYEDFIAGYPPPHIPTNLIPVRDSGDATIANIPTVEKSYNCVAAWGPPPSNYEGMTDPNGLIPVSSNCIDPGNGSGTYKALSGGEVAFTALQNCEVHCGIITTTSGIIHGSIGCKFEWDPNYCETCESHDAVYCEYNYTTSTGGSGGSSGFGSGTGGVGFIGTGTCFTGETLITMEDGTIKRIDEVIVGDIVKSEINTSIVGDIDIHKEKEYTIYSLNDSKAFVTAEHPFKTTTGWKAIDPLETWKTHGIESNILEVGDILITKEGTEEVKSITSSSETVDTVYNLRLDNEHVYYANNYLVHNNKWGGLGDDDPWADPWGDPGVGESALELEKCSCGVFGGVEYFATHCC